MTTGARGYGEGGVDAILSAETVAAEAQSLAAGGISRRGSLLYEQ